MIFNSLHGFYNLYEMPLARVMWRVSQRGLLVDQVQLTLLKLHLETELDKVCKETALLLGRPVGWSAETSSASGCINLNSVKQLTALLKDLGLKLYINRKTGRESTGEDQLNQMFAETGHSVLKNVLRIRELTKIKGTYVEAKLLDGVLYSQAVVTGTVTGRRSNRKNFMGFGTNFQNLPKHSELGERFRRCIISRPGKIFVSCDQIQAEDWIINGIVADVVGWSKGLEELQQGIDRHTKLAAFLLSLPEDQCGKDSTPRYLAKRARYAFSYGIGGRKLSLILANDGYQVPEVVCNGLLRKTHEYDPAVKEVFQKYVEDELRSKRRLYNLVGRERYFFALRPYGDNSSVFRDGYSYIPQGTVGDNTGLAILHCEREAKGLVVSEVHDSLTLEVEDSIESIITATKLLGAAFDRVLTFPNGTEITIPIEYEIGYNLHEVMKFKTKVPLHKCDSLVVDGLITTLNTCRLTQKLQSSSTGGLPSPALQQA
jgi:DNA polymerase-1